MVRLNTVRVFALLACALALVGCKDKEKEQALSRAAAAEISLSKVKADLMKAEGQIVGLKEELGAAKNTRDELENQVKQLASERDNAIAKTAGGQDEARKLTDQLNEQTHRANELQSQVAQLQKTIEDQRQTLEQLRKTIEDLKHTAAPSTTEPNAAAPEQ